MSGSGFETIDLSPSVLGLGNEIPWNPDRIIVHIGDGFILGMFCGLFSHPIKAIYNFPKIGFKGFKGYSNATLTNIPRLGGKFGAFFSTWVVLNCTMDHFHGQQYTEFHDLISLPPTIALFKSRQGFRVASRSVIGWGSLYTVFYLLRCLLEKNKGRYKYDGYVTYVEKPLPLSSANVDEQVLLPPPPPPPHKSAVVPAVSSFEDSWISTMNHQERLKNFGGRMLFGGLADWWSSIISSKEHWTRIWRKQVYSSIAYDFDT